MATLAEFKAMLDAMPQDKAASLLSGLSQSYGVRERTLERRGARAEELEETPTPGMRDAGVYKIAANPLEHIGSVARRGIGSKRAAGVSKETEALATEKQDALMAMMKQILDNQNQAKRAMGGGPGGAPGGAPGAAPMGRTPGGFGGGAPRISPFGGGGAPVGRGGLPSAGTGLGRSPFST